MIKACVSVIFKVLSRLLPQLILRTMLLQTIISTNVGPTFVIHHCIPGASINL